jgi:pimeloyl-ACP methyl ester carboxylesterase
MSGFGLKYNDPPFASQPGATTLVVMLHAFRWNHDKLVDLIGVVEEALGKDKVDIYAPTLPYSHMLDSTGAGALVVDLVGDLDKIWNEKYQKVIFVGHSLGGTISRRLFLAGSLNPPDYSDGNRWTRDDLWTAVAELRNNKPLPCEWAKHVDRLVLLATWDKGWSISDRIAWFYAIGLNALGLWGRIREVGEAFGINGKRRARTMLDMRKGAPFIVQTRLLWMAYRRWHNDNLRKLYNASHPGAGLAAPNPKEAVNPLVIQIIGAQDDFVSPQDQVDKDVEAAAWAEGDTQVGDRLYYLLEMSESDHGGVVDFSNKLGRTSGILCKPVVASARVLAKRAKVFQDALTLPPAQLSAQSFNPMLFFDQQEPSDPLVEDVVFVMHGIRDDGYWTHRIAEAVKAADAAQPKAAPPVGVPAPKPMVSCTPTYGYFPMGAFIMPWIRREKVEWFMDTYVEVRARYPRVRTHYVGHSNGTYLAASALRDYPAARFGKIYFAGSVVNPTFDWRGKVNDGRIEKFHNARGGSDWVVAFLPKSLEYFSDLGGGGFDGFEDALVGNPKITQSDKFAKGGHGGAIEEVHWPQIAQFIVTGDKPFKATGEKTGPDDPFMDERVGWMKFLSNLRIGVLFAFSVAALLGLLLFSLWLPCADWRWSAWSPFGDWGRRAWLVALVGFLALNFVGKRKTGGTNPAPRGMPARVMTALFIVCAAGVTNFILTSLAREAAQFAWLDSQKHWVAFDSAGAAFILAVVIAGARFVLTKF